VRPSTSTTATAATTVAASTAVDQCLNTLTSKGSGWCCGWCDEPLVPGSPIVCSRFASCGVFSRSSGVGVVACRSDTPRPAGSSAYSVAHSSPPPPRNSDADARGTNADWNLAWPCATAAVRSRELC